VNRSMARLGTSLGVPVRSCASTQEADPTHTALTEIYEPPLRAWAAWWRTSIATACTGRRGKPAILPARSSKCKGPAQWGERHWQTLPEAGRSIAAGPQFRMCRTTAAPSSSYYTWVDWFDTLGLGRNVPLATGNLNDAMLALGKRAVRQPARALFHRLLSPNGPKGASTMRMPAGRAERCGRPTPRGRCSTSKAVRRTDEVVRFPATTRSVAR